MYIQSSTNQRKKVLAIQGKDLTPKVVEYKQYITDTGKIDTYLILKIFCPVSLLNEKNNRSTMESNAHIDSIDVRLSKNNLNHYKGVASETSTGQKTKENNFFPGSSNKKMFGSFKNKKKNNSGKGANNLGLATLNKTLVTGMNFKTNNVLGLFQDAFYVGNLSIVESSSKSSSNIKLPKIKKRSIVYNDMSGKESTDSDRTSTSILSFSSFKNKYNSMIEAGRDPAVLFQNSYNKTTYLDKSKGRINKNSFLKINDEFKDFALPVIENIFNLINTQSENKNYKIASVTEEISEKLLEVSVKINLSRLEKFGQKINVLLLCKNNRGVQIEAGEYIVDLDDIINQIEYGDVTYDISSTRANSSILSIVSNNKKGIIDLNVHAKKIKRSIPFENTFYKTYERVILNPHERKILFDGVKETQSKNSNNNFKPAETVFYRTTINFLDKKFDNCRSTYDRGRSKEENIPNCGIYVKNNPNNDSVKIGITNISENVLGVRPVKYRYTGSVKGDKKPILVRQESGKLSILKDFIDAEGTSSNLFIDDYDVFSLKNYMYSVECLMKNGEIKTSPAYFIHSFRRRDGTVKIDDIELTKNSIIFDSSDSDSDMSLSDITRSIDIKFKIKKVQTEVDKIITNLFGDLFDVFKTDLEKIKDIQGLVYSVEIVRINKDTGESETIGKVSADNDGNCHFVDENSPALQNITYMFNPRVSLASNLIDGINESIKLLGNKTIGSSLNYLNASNRARSKEKESNIFTSTNNKYNKRNLFLKGLIETPQFTLNQSNFDIFFNSETGDVEYFDIPTSDIQSSTNSFSVANQNITKIKIANNSEENYYDMTFDFLGNDYFVDFFAVFIKEENSVYLDGIIHSKDSIDEASKYAYLLRHRKSIGIAEYFIVPFLKNGSIKSPIFVAAQILE